MVQRLCVFPELWTLAAMCLGFKLPLLGLSLAQVGYSPLEGFFTTICQVALDYQLTPRLALPPDPEPRIFLVRIVPFMPFSYVQD